MNRIELLDAVVAKHPSLTRAEAGRVLATLLDTIQTTVKKGGTVSLVGFGTFKLTTRAARKGRNPRTGEPVKVPATKTPKFVAGTAFKEMVDPKFAKRRAEKAAAAPAKAKSTAGKAAGKVAAKSAAKPRAKAA